MDGEKRYVNFGLTGRADHMHKTAVNRTKIKSPMHAKRTTDYKMSLFGYVRSYRVSRYTWDPCECPIISPHSRNI